MYVNKITTTTTRKRLISTTPTATAFKKLQLYLNKRAAKQNNPKNNKKINDNTYDSINTNNLNNTSFYINTNSDSIPAASTNPNDNNSNNDDINDDINNNNLKDINFNTNTNGDSISISTTTQKIKLYLNKIAAAPTNLNKTTRTATTTSRKTPTTTK